MKKISWKVYISLSLIYLLSCFGLINLIGQNSLKLDQQRITAEANQILQEISTDSSLRFPDNIVIQPEKTSNSATKAIQNGASYFQTSSQGKLTMTFPINEDGKIRSYLSITETITSTHFSTTLSLLVLTLLFLSSLTFLLLHSRKLKSYQLNLLKNVSEIEHDPLNTTYLIGDSQDLLANELNKLGEQIRINQFSQSEKKENLYSFIDFFQFPIFIYDARGALHASNSHFKKYFQNVQTINDFKENPDFLSFLVEKSLNPISQEKTLYFENLKAYYVLNFLPLSLINIERRYMVTMSDITSYKNALISQRELLANVSHELKTPLASIRGFSEILEKGNLAPNDSQAFASRISHESQRLLALVADILQLSRPSNTVKKIQINISDLLKKILSNYHDKIEEKFLELTCEIEEINLLTNEELLYAIFKNLVENAILYSPDYGKILIQLKPSPKNLSFKSQVEFRISNSGKGLSELEKLHIFDRFYRTDSARSENSNGTGLGLAIVKNNVQVLEGQITVQSQIGKGVSFIIKF